MTSMTYTGIYIMYVYYTNTSMYIILIHDLYGSIPNKNFIDKWFCMKKVI